MTSRGKPPGHYGVDAPYVPILSALAAVVCGVLAVVLGPGWLFLGVIFGAQVVIYLHTTLRGKYEDDLRALGAEDVSRRTLGPSGWFGGPWAATRLVRARVPSA